MKFSNPALLSASWSASLPCSEVVHESFWGLRAERQHQVTWQCPCILQEYVSITKTRLWRTLVPSSHNFLMENHSAGKNLASSRRHTTVLRQQPFNLRSLFKPGTKLCSFASIFRKQRGFLCVSEGRNAGSLICLS